MKKFIQIHTSWPGNTIPMHSCAPHMLSTSLAGLFVQYLACPVVSSAHLCWRLLINCASDSVEMVLRSEYRSHLRSWRPFAFHTCIDSLVWPSDVLFFMYDGGVHSFVYPSFASFFLRKYTLKRPMVPSTALHPARRSLAQVVQIAVSSSRQTSVVLWSAISRLTASLSCIYHGICALLAVAGLPLHLFSGGTFWLSPLTLRCMPNSCQLAV